MKLAIACKKEMVTGNLETCDYFKVYKIEDKRITYSSVMANDNKKQAEHIKESLLAEGVQAIVSEVIDKGIAEALSEKGIKVIMGAKGRANDIADIFANGRLSSSSSIQHYQYDCKNKQK